MTAVLIFGMILIAAGMFAAGVASGPSVRGAWWRLDDKRREARARRQPEAEAVPDHPRFGPLISTPPEGIEVTRGDGVLSVRADLPVQRALTEDHAPTCDFTAVPYVPEPPSWAQPPPSMAELRAQYDSWKETAYERPDVTASVSAWRPDAYGTDRCEADMQEAERQDAGLST